MALPVNESTTEISPIKAAAQTHERNAAPGVASPGDSSAPRMDAVGAEIPVVVHASRHSVTGNEAVKTASAVHEETRTVVVFPTGAVVCVAAPILTGEVVIVTNQQTGRDVICRVASVKAQTGTLNYVNLEFTRPAPGFWGACLPAESRPRNSSPEILPVQFPSPAAKKLPGATLPNTTVSNTVRTPSTRGPVLVPAAELMSAVEAVTNFLNATAAPGARVPQGSAGPEGSADLTADGFLAESQSPVEPPASRVENPAYAPTPRVAAASNEVAQAQPLTLTSEPPNASRFGSPFAVPAAARASSPAASRTADVPAAAPKLALPATVAAPPKPLSTVAASFRQNFTNEKPFAISELHVHPGPGSSKKFVLIAAAAVVLVICGAVGGALMRHQTGSAGAQPVSASATVPPATDIASGPAVAANSAVANGTAGVQPASVSTYSPDASPVAPADRYTSDGRSSATEAPKAAPVPAAASHRTAMANLAAPKSMKATQTASLEPPPTIAGQLGTEQLGNLVGKGIFGAPANVAAPSAPASAPAAPAAHMGGNLQQPKLLSSVSPAYPSTARSANVQGAVVIDALIDAKGKVASMTPVSGSMLLQPAAMSAVSRWAYEPGRLNGEAIPMHIRVNVDFRLGNDRR